MGRPAIHGHARDEQRTPTYCTWVSMLSRCRNPNYPRWDYYGGRGITACERWSSFENFLADMGDRPAGTMLDRIDNSGNYEPGNCRWATPSQNNRNRRSCRFIEHNGERMTVVEWAERLGMKKSTIGWRLRHGRTVAEALSPTRKYG